MIESRGFAALVMFHQPTCSTNGGGAGYVAVTE